MRLWIYLFFILIYWFIFTLSVSMQIVKYQIHINQHILYHHYTKVNEGL